MFFEVNNNKSFLSYVLSSLVIILILNWVSQDLFIRFDLTDNKMFSLSDSSKSVVKKLNEKLTMKVYFSDDLPGQLQNNKRYIQDLIDSDNMNHNYLNLFSRIHTLILIQIPEIK